MCMQSCPCACVVQCLRTSTHGQPYGQPTAITCASAGTSAGSRPSLASVAEPPGLAKAARVEDADATGDTPSEEVDAGSGGGRVLGAPLPSTPLAVQTSAQVMRGARRSSAHAHLAGTGSSPRSLRPSVVVTRCAPLPPTSAQLQATMRRQRPCYRPSRQAGRRRSCPGVPELFRPIRGSLSRPPNSHAHARATRRVGRRHRGVQCCVLDLY